VVVKQLYFSFSNPICVTTYLAIAAMTRREELMLPATVGAHTLLNPHTLHSTDGWLTLNMHAHVQEKPVGEVVAQTTAVASQKAAEVAKVRNIRALL
jgi:hypothetical protein